MAVLVDLQRVTVRRAGRALFEDLSVTVSDGDRLGLVGINGTGKSTLLRVMAGTLGPDDGQVNRGRGARVGFLQQQPELPPGRVRDAVGAGWEGEAALDRLGMGPYLSRDVSELSGGQLKRVALARVLAQPADLLVLDEPTNHLDLAAVAWLERALAGFKGGLVLVTHDRHLLDRATTRTLELDRGRAYTHEGGYQSYLEAKAERAEQTASSEATRRNLARKELAWLRRGAKARSRKPQARVAAAKLIIEARPEAASGTVDLQKPQGLPRLGDKVIECRQVGFAYGDGAPVLSGVDLTVVKDDRLGVVGANGSGKTTLLDLLAGRRQPSDGTVGSGPTVVIGYHDQAGLELPPEASVRELVAGPHRAPGSVEDINLMNRFLFSGDLPFAKVQSLSGGEKRRLQLLLVIAAQPNVLLLDEPTNDLDLDTLRSLEDFLEDWPGALVVVSHDRTFLERTTERLVAVGTDTSVTPITGGIDAWIGQNAIAVPSTATRPARARVKQDNPAPLSAATAKPVSKSTVQRRLRDAEKQLAKLEVRRDEVAGSLAVAEGYQELARLGTELAEAQEALDKAEEAWLALAVEA